LYLRFIEELILNSPVSALEPIVLDDIDTVSCVTVIVAVAVVIAIVIDSAVVIAVVVVAASIVVSVERPDSGSELGLGDILFLSVECPTSPRLLVVNVYNAPPGATNPGAGVSRLITLADAQFPSNPILAGGLNLHHPLWHSSYSVSPSTQSKSFIRWLESRELSLISEIDKPTHIRGNLLDLCFGSNQIVAAGTLATTQEELDVTSDHTPLLVTVACNSRNSTPMTKLRFGTIEKDKFMALLSTQLDGILSLSDKSPASLDKRAEDIIQILLCSFSGSVRRSLPHTKGQPWWNQSCKEAKIAYREKIRAGNASQVDRKAFRKVSKHAKIAFFQKKVDEATNAKDVFVISKWHKTRGIFRTPPVKDPLSPDSPPEQKLESKMRILIRNLLSNQSEVEDIPLSTPIVAHTSLPFPELTASEVSNAILSAGNTTPGKDQIPSSVLRLAWPRISVLVQDLFQACLDTGHHPKCFRTAIVAIIGKPNKVDMSSPRSYRPIALLSVLGKGLERLVAKRMSWIAIKYKVLARQQFGALPQRSSTDLTTCLTHDVETALAKGLTASMATLDIKGAFDAVLPGRLIKRLREQGWPAQLCNWIASFATNREICIRLDGQIGNPTEINCGFPQGSPVSPILFMLFIAPLFKLDGLKKAFGYADDVAALEVSPSLEENSIKLGIAINQALTWGSSEGINFDPVKSELIHFSRKRRDRNARPQVETTSFAISENSQKPYLRWLGINFDKKLTFKHHAQIQASKAIKVAHALRCLGNTVRGVSPCLSRQAALACVLPIAHFGAETWWPGKSRANLEKLVCNRVGTHLRAMEKVHTAAARAVLPVYRTTHSIALFREAGLNPAELSLNNISRRSAIRTRRLDPYHPLRVRGQKAILTPAFSRFSRSCRDIPASEYINPLVNPPWEIIESRQNSHTRACGPTRQKHTKAATFSNFLLSLPRSDILVYSDGTKLPNGNTGGGFVIYQFGIQVRKEAFPLGQFKECLDAEVHAALLGIRAAIALSSARFANNMWIFTDNEEVARKLLTKTPTTSAQSIFLEALKAAEAWKTRTRLSHILEGKVDVRWVPGHAGIEGNILADLEAKKGATMPYLGKQEYSFASLEKWHVDQQKRERDDWWEKKSPPSYKKLGIRHAPFFPKELLLSRRHLGRVVVARTCHGDFAAYHTRFKHTEATTTCLCGHSQTPTHFLFCRILRRHRGRPQGPINQLLPVMGLICLFVCLFV
ncbi:hypothetical protein K3495_g12850, partial [Podosphaera aphanis]